MKHFFLITFVGVTLVVVFDLVGSFAARELNFAYGSVAPGSFLIYATTGFAISKYVGFAYALLASGIVALVEATIGWYVSWIIGPGRVEGAGLNEIVFAIVFVVLTGILGLVGGGVAYAVRSR